jgi:cysteine desulfurase
MNLLLKYWDASATTHVDKRILDTMLPFFTEIFGNTPSNQINGKQANWIKSRHI